jgi:phosphohistidine swiveling domain-containing protein
MGIPCIVGTQRATQMLRDGDRVTIDTKAGWVKRVDAQRLFEPLL